MFSFLRKRVLTGGDLCFFRYSSLVKFISTDATSNNSFVVSYLINTCGVSQEKAISASKRVQFESSKNPDSVITLLRKNGFTNTHISKLIGKYPLLLVYRVDKNLKPKIDFFKSQGIFGSDLAAVFCKYPRVLMTSLERRIIPYFGIIKSAVQTDAKLIALLKRSAEVLTEDPQKNLLPNVALLRAQGVRADYISKLLIAQPRVLLVTTSRFREIVEKVKHMNFDPSQYVFLVAVQGLSSMSRSSLEAKVDVYRRWGLCEDELQCMFRRNPYCLMLSEKNITSTMEFFVKEMGYSPLWIAKQPNVLLLSLTRRIIPRCSIFQMLKAKGLIGDERNIGSLLKMTEEVFLKYIIKFEKEVPEVLASYKGSLMV